MPSNDRNHFTYFTSATLAKYHIHFRCLGICDSKSVPKITITKNNNYQINVMISDVYSFYKGLYSLILLKQGFDIENKNLRQMQNVFMFHDLYSIVTRKDCLDASCFLIVTDNMTGG